MDPNKINRISNKILSEQIAPNMNTKAQKAMGWTDTQIKTQQDKRAKERQQSASNFWNTYKHDIMMAAEIGALAIPVAGPFISAGLAAADAKMYWDEGDKYTAGFIATLTAIPVIGSLAVKIPGVKQLGAKGMVSLAKKMKLIKGGAKPALTATEKEVIHQLGKNQKLVQAETKKYLAKKTARKAATKKVLKKGAKTIGKAVANYQVSKAAWNSIYTKSGIASAEVDALIKPALDKLARQAKRLTTTRTESKLSLDNIIREELHTIQEQFKSSGKSATTPKSKTTTTTTTKTNKPSTNNVVYYGVLGFGTLMSAIALYTGYRVLKYGIKATRRLSGNLFSKFAKLPGELEKAQAALKKGGADALIQQNPKYFKNWTPEQINGLKKALNDPKSLTGAIGMIGNEGVEQFLKGNMNATALKSMLSPELQQTYGPFIDAIERSRVATPKAPTGMYTSTSTAAPKPAAPAPAPKPSGTKSPYGVNWPAPGGEWTKI